jgi:hypothetical protein
MSYRNFGRMTLIAAAMAALSCSNELNRSASPVLLLVTNTQDIHQIDLAGGTGCDATIGSISVTATLKNPASDVTQTFNQVRITRYRVSYVRTDGGTAVPAPFVRSTDLLISPGGAGTPLSDFLVLTADQVTQAPFASLLPQNGGRDPETQRRVVRMDVIVDVFGETLAGTNVSGRTRFPLDFCYQCSPLGCS